MSIARIRPAYVFTPTQISGCQLWLDAADATTITGTSPITQWKDKSGSGNNATAVGSPTYGTNAVVLGGSAYFTVPGVSANSPNEAVFVVVNWSSSGADYPAFIATSLDGGRYLSTEKGSQTLFGSSYYVATTSVGTAGATPYNKTIMVEMMTTSLVNTVYTNGGSAGSPVSVTYSGGGTTVIGVGIHGGPTSSQYLTGSLYEIIIYNTALSTTQRQQIEGYLAQKWGIKSLLPGNHPGTKCVYWPQKVTPFITPTPFYTAFSPLSISGCQVWLDASDVTTLTGSSPVTAWKDKSSNALTLTATGSPTRTIVNGLTSLSFNGSSYFSLNPFTQASGANYMAWFAVTNITNAASTSYAAVIGTLYVATSNSQNELYINTGTAQVYYRLINPNTGYGNTGNAVARSTSITVNAGNVLLGTTTDFTTGTYQVFQNGTGGTLQTDGPIGTNSSEQVSLQIGNDLYPGDGFIQGTISELILYTTTLTRTQRQQVESYLAAKWSLTSSLPTSHQHFTQPAGHNPKIPLQLTINQLWRSPNYYLTGITYQNLSQTYWNNNWQLYLQSLASSPITATVNLNVITASGTNYQGFVLAPNGYIYCVPCNNTAVGYISPTGQFGTFGSATSGGFVSGALAPNGNIYCIKFYGGNIGIITPGASPASSTWSETGPSIANNRFSCCFGTDGLLYIPSPDVANIGVYTPGATYSTTYLTNIGTITGGYAGIVLAPNGKLYCIPNGATNVGVIDTVARTFTVAGLTVTGSATGYRGGVLAPNGKIYCLPDTATKVGVIDPVAGTFSDAVVSNVGTFTKSYMSGTLGPDGNIYCISGGTNSLAVINVASNTFTQIGGSFAGANGIMLSPNGIIYTIPGNSTAINTITFSNVSQLPNSNWCLSAYANHV